MILGKPHLNYNSETLTLSATCNHCGETTHFENITSLDIDIWAMGGLIQNVFPNIPPAERELIISGMCPKCFTEIFGPNPFLPPQD